MLTIVLFLLGFAGISFGQNGPADYQRQYENAKDLYQLGKYELAMEAFRPLTGVSKENPYSELATFYFSLSAYNSGSRPLARDMFLQLTKWFPEWNQMDEVYLWLAKINFENENYFQGYLYSLKVKGESAKRAAGNMKTHFINNIDNPVVLESLLKEYPDDRDVAITLARLIDQQPLETRDFLLLDSLVTIYNLERAQFTLGEIMSSPKKDTYHIAVLFPFMFEDLQPFRGRRSNQFILDIYDGMLMALEQLNYDGPSIIIHPYDTKKDSATTRQILETDEMKAMDVIVGPFYPEPFKLVKEFSFTNKINMINPLSNNSSVIEKNPFSFLFNPSSETIARRSAEFVSDTISNKTTAIYYGTGQQDSIMAYTYKKLIEADSFNVIINQKVTRENSQIIYDVLAGVYEVPDTLDLDPESDVLELLVIKPDSIGHIFVASNDRLIASNVISSVEFRGDTTQVVGSYEWLSLDFAKYSLVEKLGIWFYAPGYIPYDTQEFHDFRNLFLRKYFEFPSKSAITGYELMMFLGRRLKDHGKYFQIAAHRPDFKAGYLGPGFDYRFGNDNQVVPILQFINGELQIINHALGLGNSSEQE